MSHQPISADDLAGALDRYRQHQPTALHAVGLAVLCERALVTLRCLDDLRNDQGRIVLRVPLDGYDRVYLAHAQAITLDLTDLLALEAAP